MNNRINLSRDSNFYPDCFVRADSKKINNITARQLFFADSKIKNFSRDNNSCSDSFPSGQTKRTTNAQQQVGEMAVDI
jgi:hypothetical protein